MTERISLVEAYDNRDVIAQLVRLRDNVDELLNILKDIDPNGDLTNVVTKTGDQTIDGVKTFIGQIVADCDIIQNGAAYETHAEQVYSVNDLIVTRDGQITGLAPGDMSGFHVKKYNGVDDSRLGVDNTGTMRVGDVGSEQPLMTRDETGDMTSGNFVLWDGVNEKAITSALGPNGVIKGSGNIGSDTQPVKIVNGEPVAVGTALLQNTVESQPVTLGQFSSGTITAYKIGHLVIVNMFHCAPSTAGDIKTGTLPWTPVTRFFSTILENGTKNYRSFYTNTNGTLGVGVVAGDSDYYGTLTYITSS